VTTSITRGDVRDLATFMTLVPVIVLVLTFVLSLTAWAK
jgi:hypothetical protein